MSFIDIKDPKKRGQIVSDYVATVRRVQQRNEDEKSAGLAKQAELEETFSPIVKATEKSTEAITKQLAPLNSEQPPSRKKQTTWDERSDQSAIDYYLNSYNKANLDKYFGIQQEENGHFLLGTKQVMIDGDSNIYVDDAVYKSTTGLWQLIMINHPFSYNDIDVKMYKDLIHRTEAKTNPNNVRHGRPTSTAKWKFLQKIFGSC